MVLQMKNAFLKPEKDGLSPSCVVDTGGGAAELERGGPGGDSGPILTDIIAILTDFRGSLGAILEQISGKLGKSWKQLGAVLCS